MPMDFRTPGLVLVSSLSGIRYLFNGDKKWALQILQDTYQQDFGYDKEAWLEYMLKHDDDFVSNLLENYSIFEIEPFMYDALKKDGRFDMKKAHVLPYPLEEYVKKFDSIGRLKSE